MMPDQPFATTPDPQPVPLLRCLLVGALGLLAACSGNLSHRSVAETSGKLPIGPEVRRLRLEIASGTLGIDVHADRELSFAGGIRRAADTAADLAILEGIPIGLAASVDPVTPDTLVVRGAAAPTPGPNGVLSYELGIRLPADLALEVVVAGNGHVTVARREAPLRVETSRGDLRFEQCRGGIKAHTGRGVVIGFGIQGDVDIETAVGDMQVFVEAPGELLRLRTGQGTIQCFVPPQAGFVCNARTSMGRVGNAFGLANEATTQYGRAMTGQHGDGRSQVILMTGSGYIALQKLTSNG